MSWNDGYNYCLLQRGNGYYEDSEDSQSSQETDSSQSSQETDSSQEVTERLNPWSRILDEAQERHEVQLNALSICSGCERWKKITPSKKWWKLKKISKIQMGLIG